MITFLSKKENGFTAIEMVISIFVLSIAVIGIFAAFSIILVLTGDAADRLTANFIAQEGMEIVRNLRDGDWINNRDWTNFGPGGVQMDCSAGCEMDYKAGTNFENGASINAWTTGNYLYKQDGSGFYIYDSANNAIQTKFKRKIIIKALDGAPPYALMVEVQVSWDRKPTILNNTSQKAGDCNPSNCISTETTLYNWFNYIPPT